MHSIAYHPPLPQEPVPPDDAAALPPGAQLVADWLNIRCYLNQLPPWALENILGSRNADWCGGHFRDGTRRCLVALAEGWLPIPGGGLSNPALWEPNTDEWLIQAGAYEAFDRRCQAVGVDYVAMQCRAEAAAVMAAKWPARGNADLPPIAGPWQ